MRQSTPTANLTKSAVPMSFGSFECAMVLMVPRCSHCNCRIVGTAVRSSTGTIYCCARCAWQAGAQT
jgi:hypothetical protein